MKALKIDTVTKSEYPELLNVWEASVRATHHFLKEKDIVVNVRRSRGKDIDAACGQLANKSGGSNDIPKAVSLA